jgi:Tol biopolymer transport system component
MDADGSSKMEARIRERNTQFTNGDGLPSTVVDFHHPWSPDGNKILFSRRMTVGYWDIYVVNADGTGLTNITNTSDETELYGGWSPDGSQVVYVNEVWDPKHDATGYPDLHRG